MWTVSSVSSGVPCASHVSSVSTTPCQSSPPTHAPQKKKTRRAGRRIRAARLRAHSSPSFNPTAVPPVSVNSSAPPPSASCPHGKSIDYIWDILHRVVHLLNNLCGDVVTETEICEIRNDLYDIKVFTGMIQPPPTYWTGDSPHLKPP
jgi:hypothetical protein